MATTVPQIIPCPKGGKVFQPTGTGRLWVQWLASGNAWRRLLEGVKAIPGKQWIANQKLWTVPDCADSRARLIALGFTPQGIGRSYASVGLPMVPEPRAVAPWTPPWRDIVLPGDWSHLREYQREGLQMLTYRKGRGALFLSMGLGKTATALSWLRMNPRFGRVVIIATASTKAQWVREAKKWGVDMPMWVLSGVSPHKLPERGAVVLNWDILAAWTEALLAWAPDCVVADEVQAVGNPTARRSKAFLRLVAGRGLVALSGTPARTAPAQLWTLLHALDPETFKDRYKYLNRYCDPRPGFHGMTYKGSTRPEELHEKIRALGIRYRKEDVLHDLPDRIYDTVLMDCVVTPEYREAQDKILALQGHSPGLLRERLAALSASAFTLKQEAVLNWISEFLATGEKLVVFGWHTAVLDFLEVSLGAQVVRVSGGVSQAGREAAVSRFIKDDACRVFLGNTQAAGVGIDGLQGVCSNVAFVELCWSPADLDQAESRLHRLGQKSAVSVYYLLANNTIDTIMAEALDRRSSVLRMVVDGNNEQDEDASIMAMLRKQRGDLR